MEAASARAALRGMRAARRRRRARQVEWVVTLYRVYLTLFIGTFAILFASGALNDANVTEDSLDWIARHGPSLLGILVAFAVEGGLRSGSRGGPLVIEAPDVQYVLLAPISHALTLRRPALRPLSRAVLAGAFVGAVAGNLAFRRLPGPNGEWVGVGAVFGAALPALWYGCAMIGSGARLGRRSAA